MYLEHEMLIGIDPEERELVFITRKGRKRAECTAEQILAPVVV
jgi:hypothetical protein